MPSASYGVIVEGPFDSPVLRTLIPRIVGEPCPVYCRETGGKVQLMRSFPKLIWTFQHVLELGGPVQRVLVVRDANGGYPPTIEHDMQLKIAGRHYPFAQHGIHVHAIQTETETRLMADIGAVNQVAVARGGRQVQIVPGPLEAIVQAKERFKRLLSDAGLLYTPQVCGEIAAAIDLAVLRLSCPSFTRFEAIVL